MAGKKGAIALYMKGCSCVGATATCALISVAQMPNKYINALVMLKKYSKNFIKALAIALAFVL